MKNRILAFILSFSFIFGFSCVSVFASGMTIYPEQGSYEFEENQIGEKFVVDFILDGNEGYNNSTFRVKYDPNVIRAVPNETSDNENDGFITYELYRGEAFRLFPNASIENQMNLTPSRGLDDFEGRSDGKKTCAEIGIIKLGQMVRSVSSVFEIKTNGIFLRMTFEVIGSGETDIELLKAAGSDVFAYGVNSAARDVSLVPVRVKVNGNAFAEESTQDNKETSTETTTEAKIVSNKNNETTTVKVSSDKTETTTKNSSSTGDGDETETTTSNSSSDKTETTTEDKSKDNNTDKTSEGTTEGASSNVSGKAENKETPANESVFSDIDRYPWAVNAINYLAENGIVNGIGGGKFAPMTNVKRADFLIMLMNALKIDVSEDGDGGFADVSSSKYYAKAVSAAKSLGIASGDDKGNFKPEEFISRQDMMVLAYRALNAAGYEVLADNSAALDKFEDKLHISNYAKESLNAMVDVKIVNGTGNNIEPKNNTTRAQAAVIVYNINEFIK